MATIRLRRPIGSVHCTTSCFVIANAWDAGSARILAGVGFAALATSSGAAAGMLGRRDGMITREELLAHARAVVEATDLPVSADLEKGFGDSPQDAALTIRMAGRDRPGRRLDRGCDGRRADSRSTMPAWRAERIAAAVEAARPCRSRSP